MAETTPDLAQYQSDHDILIELRTEMRLLRDTIKDSSDGVRRILDDHEKRLRDIERAGERWFGKQSAAAAFVAAALALIAAYVSTGYIHL